MSLARPKGGTSVMSQRVEAPDSLEFFPTPPWATRALCEHVLSVVEHPREVAHPREWPRQTVWEPAAGEGHMAEPLKEYFESVWGSDVHSYGKGYAVGSFLGEGADRATYFDRDMDVEKPDWIITNPPFRLAKEFAERALQEAQVGVALLLRSVFIESEDRYHFFEKHPLTLVAPFAERVAMTKGRWDPKASTATSYAWFVWIRGHTGPTTLRIIPPGRKRALTKPDDAALFGWSPPAQTQSERDHIATAAAALGQE